MRRLLAYQPLIMMIEKRKIPFGGFSNLNVKVQDFEDFGSDKNSINLKTNTKDSITYL